MEKQPQFKINFVITATLMSRRFVRELRKQKARARDQSKAMKQALDVENSFFLFFRPTAPTVTNPVETKDPACILRLPLTVQSLTEAIRKPMPCSILEIANSVAALSS